MPSTSPETYRSLMSLRVVRNYLPDPVPEADVAAILEAGRWTGSAKNRQDWVFVIVSDPDVKERLTTCGDFTRPLHNAPMAIAIVGTPTAYVWDLGRAAQNMMLAAASLGLGSCPVTMHREADAREVLGVPDDHWCRILITVGYADVPAEQAARKASSMSGRRPAVDLVRHDRFA